MEPFDDDGPVQVFNRRDLLDFKEIVSDILHHTKNQTSNHLSSPSDESTASNSDEDNNDLCIEYVYQLGLPTTLKGR